MSGKDGHIRYKAVAAVLIMLLIGISVLAVMMRLPAIASRLDIERHIAVYLEEKEAERSFAVWLHSANGPVMTERSIPLPLISDDLHLAAEAMLMSETPEDIAEGLVSYIPDGTRLIGIAMEGNYVFADFSEELQGAPAEALEEIRLTLQSNTGAENIVIMIDGSECKALD